MTTTENFLQQQNRASDTENPRLHDDTKIEELLREQEKLQKLYNEVVLYIQQHPQMLTEEMIKYQTQLKELSEYYQLNQQKLKTLGYSSVQVNKNVIIKSGAKKNISIKTIFLGCSAIVFMFLLGLIFLFFYLVKNPSQFSGLWSLGITPSVAKGLLQGLSLTVMLVVLLLGIVILIINVYKSFTEKNKPKGWYYSGIFLGIIILGLGLAAGTRVLGEIAKIDVETLANPEDVVLLSMNGILDGEAKLIKIDGTFPLIAPTNVSARLLVSNFQKFITLQLGAAKINRLQLDCGNGQLLNYSGKTSETFERDCFYTKKGNYPIKLMVEYPSDTNTNEQKSASYLLKTLVVGSELTIQGVDKPIKEENNELVIGPLPAEVEFKADKVFRDFNLRNYRVYWDGDNDGTDDKLDDATFNFVYDKSQVYYPKIRFPELSEKIAYSFPLRVEQSWTPVCSIKLEQQKINDYLISASFFDGTERFISDHSFVFYDKATGKMIDEIHDTDLGFQFDYRFPGKGTYIVKMNFITSDDKRGSCEIEAHLLEKSSFNVSYEVSASSPNDMTYRKLDSNAILEKKVVALAEIPTKLKLRLLKIEPKTLNTKVNVYLDDAPVIFTNDSEYLFDIRDSLEHKIKIQIQDKVRGLDYEELLTTKIWLDDIIGKLLVLGENIGFEPFEVTLDASSSRLNDPNDQITYFSWDFGDGQLQQKVSNGVIKHKYRFDYTNDNGTFTPKVTIFTQKGRSIVAVATSHVVVKKQLIKLDIHSVSHPTQETKIWDSVSFSLDFNGLPKKVSRDFGDGVQPIECEGRTCTEMTKSRSEKGNYLIKVKMDFEDQQSVEQTMQFRVRE